MSTVWTCAFIALLTTVPALAGDVALQWDPNSETDLAGYKVYYGTASGSYGAPLNAGNITNYTVTGLGPGTYYFAVTAYNTSGSESSFSNEVSTTVGSSCTYSIAPATVSFSAKASNGSATVTTSSGCAWSASSGADWLSVTSGSSGTGSGTVTYSASINNSTAARTGSLTIAGNTISVTQAKAGCDINLDSTTSVLDIQVLINVILGASNCPAACDINADTGVNVIDLQLLQNVILGVRSCS